jgi:hypothetical protein
VTGTFEYDGRTITTARQCPHREEHENRYWISGKKEKQKSRKRKSAHVGTNERIKPKEVKQNGKHNPANK